MSKPLLEMKGTAVATQMGYVRDNFGEDGYQQWIEALSPEARTIVEGAVLESNWYEGECAVVELRSKICQVFYKGDPRGSWELGRYSAERALTGIYKVFLRVGSPNWMIDRGNMVFNRFFRPGLMETVQNEKNLAITQLKDFPESTGLVEMTIAGFIEKGLELSGTKNINVLITKSFSRGDDYTEFKYTWT